MENLDFREKGYQLYRNAISQESCDMISSYFHLLKKIGRLEHQDSQVPDAYALPDDNFVNSILYYLTDKYQNFIEGIYKSPLIPTYSYSRWYVNGNVLHPHKDRLSCEMSATLTIDFDKPWPIFIRDYDGKSQEVNMNKGDLIFYHGCELEHWREEFKGEYAIQIFLHYVRADNIEAENVNRNRILIEQQNAYLNLNNEFPLPRSGNKLIHTTGRKDE